ncbi:MAG: hypothetical protein RLZZ11_2021 [Cyanobacteriota bacterium]
MTDDRPADFGAQRADAAERLAKLPYDALALRVMDGLAAMAIQHRAWCAALRDDQADALACGCGGCREMALGLSEGVAQFARDLLRLEQAADLVMDVGSYELPDGDYLTAEVLSYRDAALEQDRAHRPEVQKLNKLLQRDCSGEHD